jgi:hypothetical protein
MISFLSENLQTYDKKNIHGGIGRYSDFYTFLKDHSIPFVNCIDVNNTNIFDSNLLKYIEYTKINSKDIVFLSSIQRILEIKHSQFENFLIHNLHFAFKLNIGFLPMFGYDSNNLYKKTNIDNSHKYKYGLYIATYDGNYNNFFNIINYLGKENVAILCQDSNYLFDKDVFVTNDTSLFINKIESLIDFYDQYASRHVMSRLYIECFLENIPFYVFTNSYKQPQLYSLLQFEHIKYILEDKIKDFKMYKVLYNQYYFKTETYTKYIRKCFETEIFNKYKEDYIESLSNNNYN